MLKIVDEGIIFRREWEYLSITAYGESALRVRAVPSKPIIDEQWTLLPSKKAACKITKDENGASIYNGDLSAHISHDGKITFCDARGNCLLRELWTLEGDIPGRLFRSRHSELFYMETIFEADGDEHFYGMGQEAHDLFDLKGSVIDLCHRNTKSTIPFALSSKGYGFLWNNPAIGRVEFGTAKTRWVAEASRQLDYIVIAGPRPADILRRYCDISGYAPDFPEWATGLWQSKLRYMTQEELLEVAREYKRRDINISIIVCDYFHWPQQGEWKFDKKFFPDPTAMVKELAGMGIKLLVSIWPTVDPRSENYMEMKEQNFLVRTERGPGVLVFCRGPETYYDTTNPEAGKFVMDKVAANYMAHGIENFWLDEAEPEIMPYDYDNLRFHKGNGMEVAALYPFYYAKNFFDGQTERGQHEIVNLIRCAFIGSQRFGAVLWSGDIMSNFDSLRRQIKTGLHVAVSGIPWWTTDIGGFNGGDSDNPVYRECMIRWFQFGAFCPVFRMHGHRKKPNQPQGNPYSMDSSCQSGEPNEIWSYGEQAYRIMCDYINIRENLRDYIGAQMRLASQVGMPVMRPLFFDFTDIQCLDIFDQYMFGPDIMVCPVYEYGVRSRKVYLPSDRLWINTIDNAEYLGDQWIEVAAPLERIPVFLSKNGQLKVQTKW